MKPLAIGKAAKAFLGFYFKSWLFLLWTALCVSAGAAAMYVSLQAALVAQGVLQ